MHPVGCVPPIRGPYPIASHVSLLGVSPTPHVCLWGGVYPLPRCRPPGCRVSPGCTPAHGYTPPGHVTSDTCWEANPPVVSMTDMCKNITLLQTLFADGRKNLRIRHQATTANLSKCVRLYFEILIVRDFKLIRAAIL